MKNNTPEIAINRSVTGDKQLQLSHRTPSARDQDVEYIYVHLQGRDVPNCSSTIYLDYGPPLAAFFKDLAEHWQGW